MPPGVPPTSPLEVVRGTLDRLVADIRTFNFQWIVPVKTATSPQMLKNPSVWVMLLLGFFPLALLTLQLTDSVQAFLTLFTAYYCFWWAGYYYWFVCQRAVYFPHGVVAMAFTAFVGVPLLLVVQKVPPVSIIYSFSNGHDVVSKLLGYVLGVGLFEEVTKALPVLILAYAAAKVEKPVDGMFFGAMSGLGFAITEGVIYIGNAQGSVAQVLIRTTTLPFLHSLWAATAGYFVALALINRKRGAALVILGLAVVAVHHGVYDVLCGVSPPLSLLAAAFLYLLFSAYVSRSQEMIRELQEAERRAQDETRLQQMFSDTLGRWNAAQAGGGGGPATWTPSASMPAPGTPWPWPPPASSGPPVPGWPPSPGGPRQG